MLKKPLSPSISLGSKEEGMLSREVAAALDEEELSEGSASPEGWRSALGTSGSLSESAPAEEGSITAIEEELSSSPPDSLPPSSETPMPTAARKITSTRTPIRIIGIGELFLRRRLEVFSFAIVFFTS